MFITKGIIVDAGASLIQDPIYDDKLKVRIPELHGFGELATTFQEKSYTKDEDLPWCKLLVHSINIETKYPVLQYKAQTYAPADIVYLEIDNESPNTNYTVIGIAAKYNEDESDMTLTIYNNIDVSSIIANKVDFPEELIDPSKAGGDSSESGDTGEVISASAWMQIVVDCKAAMAEQAGYYSQSTQKNFNVDGEKYAQSQAVLRN